MRSSEPGWVLCAMHDPTGRRGVWMRERRDEDGRLICLEVCGGREGDDFYARFEVGVAPTLLSIERLEDILDTQRWMLEESRG